MVLPDRNQRGSNLAPQLMARFACPEVHAERAELRGALVLRRAVEDVRSPGDLDLLESAFGQEREQLCFQQSAGDSTGP